LSVGNLERKTGRSNMRGRCDVILLRVGRRCRRRLTTRQQVLRMNDLRWLFAINDAPTRSGAPQSIIHSVDKRGGNGFLRRVHHILATWVQKLGHWAVLSKSATSDEGDALSRRFSSTE